MSFCNAFKFYIRWHILFKDCSASTAFIFTRLNKIQSLEKLISTCVMGWLCYRPIVLLTKAPTNENTKYSWSTSLPSSMFLIPIFTIKSAQASRNVYFRKLDAYGLGLAISSDSHQKSHKLWVVTLFSRLHQERTRSIGQGFPVTSLKP